jgi:hypothetical protein
MGKENNLRQLEENYYQAVTMREPKSGKSFSPQVFVTGYAGFGLDQLVQLTRKRYDLPTDIIQTGFIALTPDGDIKKKRLPKNPAHYIVVIRDPMRTYAERMSLSLEDLQAKMQQEASKRKDSEPTKSEKDIAIIRELQAVNLKQTADLSYKSGAGFSTIYIYPEREKKEDEPQTLFERQAEFLVRVVRNVTNSGAVE